MSERRDSERRQQWIPVEINGADEGYLVSHLAVTHNASDKGVLVVTAHLYRIGEILRLRFGESPEVTVITKGRVVRAGPNQDDPTGLWPYAVAVEFLESTPGLTSLLSQSENES